MRPFAAAITALCVTGCATLALHEFDQRYGKPDPTRYDVAAKPEAGMSYRQDVQPILERRCVVCHACYDGPCQLKLTAWEGIARGTSKVPVYDAARLREAPTDAPIPRRAIAFAVVGARILAGAQQPHRNARDQSGGERALSQPATEARASAADHAGPVQARSTFRSIARRPARASTSSRASQPSSRSRACPTACPGSTSANSRRSSAGLRRARLTKAIHRCHPRCRNRFASGKPFSTANRTRSG